MRALIDDMRAQWRELDEGSRYRDEFADRAPMDETTRRLTTIPGIGVLNATALVAAIGDATHSIAAGIWRPGLGWCPDRRDRRPVTPGRNHQTGQQIPPQIAGPWRRSAMRTLAHSATPLGA